MEPSAKKNFEATIDPVSLILPTKAYLIWLEIHNPREILKKVFEKMAPAERTAAVEHAKAVAAKVNALAKEVEAVAAKFN
jgi:hypothetical protein